MGRLTWSCSRWSLVSEELETETYRTTIRRGLSKVEAFVAPDGTVKVTKQKQLHDTPEGEPPRDFGPERTLYEGHCMDAALVADVLKEMFESEA